MSYQNHSLGEPPPKRIAVFRALKLGDMLCAVPALRALRNEFPEAEITLIGLPWASAFAALFPGYVNRFIAFPGYPGLPEQAPHLAELPAFISSMQKESFDLVIQMQGDGSITNPLISLFAARRNAGFAVPGAYRPDKEFFFPYPGKGPEILRNVRLLEHLGIPSAGEYLEFPVQTADFEEWRTIANALSLNKKAYVCIHPGASMPSHRWPAHLFARVGDSLSERGLQVVLTGGAEERDLTRQVSAGMKRPAIDLAGQTSLGALAALLLDAAFLVCNCTGISHIAAALQIPSVVISIESDPDRWSPLNRNLHRVLHNDTGITYRDVMHEILTISSKGHRSHRDGAWPSSKPPILQSKFPEGGEENSSIVAMKGYSAR